MQTLATVLFFIVFIEAAIVLSISLGVTIYRLIKKSNNTKKEKV